MWLRVEPALPPLSVRFQNFHFKINLWIHSQVWQMIAVLRDVIIVQNKKLHFDDVSISFTITPNKTSGTLNINTLWGCPFTYINFFYRPLTKYTKHEVGRLFYSHGLTEILGKFSKRMVTHELGWHCSLMLHRIGQQNLG